MARRKTTKIETNTKTAKRKPAVRKQKAKKPEVDQSSTEIRDEAEIAAGTESVETAVDNSFFYTCDKVFDELDQKDILDSVILEYPGFSTDNDDSTIKRTLVEILENEDFMSKILSYYNITIYEFFKLLYKNYASIFKGLYLKKIRHEVEGKSYAKPIRRKDKTSTKRRS